MKEANGGAEAEGKRDRLVLSSNMQPEGKATHKRQITLSTGELSHPVHFMSGSIRLSHGKIH
jgi:hypothetical protein